MNTLSGSISLQNTTYQTNSLLLTSSHSKLEKLALTAPWKKMKTLLDGTSKTIGKPFQNPILMMKLLVLQELLDIDTEQLRPHLGSHYSLFVFLIPGMENGLPDSAEVNRLKQCLQEMNLLYPFLSECVEILGVDRSKINLYEYYENEASSQSFSSSCSLHSLACPRCGRKNLHIRKQSLIAKLIHKKKAYTCNICTLHFAL
jgi:hypothetical protein